MRNIITSRSLAGLTLLVCLLGAAGPAHAREAAPAEVAPIVDDGVESGDVLMGGDDIDWGDEGIDWGGDAASEAPAARDPDKGLIKGRVVAEGSDTGLIEARVTVEGTAFGTRTDLDGAYSLELPPGTWELRVWHELHFPQRIPGVIVEAGSEQVLDVPLVPDDKSVLTFRVEAEADNSRAAVQMEKRKRAAVVMDAVSAEEMSKTPDSSAADAMKRVVGASIVDGKYLVVRGLGGRYTTTLLEGVAVPNPEPDMPSIPLDLFPSALLSSVSVAKTATPDLPGNFAGGALLLDSKQYPGDFHLKLDAGFSGDSIGTFQKGPRYTGGSTDWLGFDDGGRALPGAIPSNSPVGNSSRAERAALGRSFDQTWSAREQSLPANMKFGASVGDTVSAFGNRLGYLANLSWGQSWDLEREYQTGLAANGPDGNFANEVAAIRKVKLGGLGSVSYQLSPTDDLGFISLFSRAADDRAQTTIGHNTNDENYEKTDLAFIARQLTFNQLRGHHRFDALGALALDWQANFSVVNRDEPDTRTVYHRVEDDGTRTLIKERGGQRLFTELEDQTFGGGFDLTLPLEGWTPKVGVLYSQSKRDYLTRRFLYDTSRTPRDVLRRGAAEIFTDSSVSFDEETRQSDSYTADTSLFSTYAMVDVSLLDPFRVIAGARFERSLTDLTHGSPTADVDDSPAGVDGRVEEDVLPSINLVYALSERANLRAAYGMTVARPQLRELSSATWYDFNKRRFYGGNSELERTRIHNADLRFEFFPGATEVLAVSVFAKQFESPIEEIFNTAEGNSVRYINAEEGSVYGIELEGRLGLYHLSDALRSFGLTANLTLADSEVDVGADGQRTQTNRRRPLHGQSAYAMNFGLLYENEGSGTAAQLLYNVFGPRLDVAGISGLPDVYEEELHRLDLIFTQGLGGGFDMKLSATNLLDQEETYTQGDTEVSRFSPGIGASASLAWTF